MVVGMDRLSDDDKESLYMCVTRRRSAQLYLHKVEKKSGREHRWL